MSIMDLTCRCQGPKSLWGIRNYLGSAPPKKNLNGEQDERN